MSLSYDALVTVDEVQRASLDSLEASFEDIEVLNETESVIHAVTERINGYMGRKLIVHQYIARYDDLYWQVDWSLDQETDTYVAAYTTEWPIVEVDSVTPTTASNPTIHASKRQLVTTLSNAVTPIRTVTTFAGYRRADHTSVAVLKAATNLEGTAVCANCDTLPMLLPKDIQEVAMEMVLSRLNYRLTGLYGMRNLTFQAGVNPITVAGGDMRSEKSLVETYETNLLRKIAHHRAIV